MDTPTPTAEQPRRSFLVPALLTLFIAGLLAGLSFYSARKVAADSAAAAVLPLAREIAAQQRAAARADSIHRRQYLSVRDSLRALRADLGRQRTAQAYETFKISLHNAELETQVDSLNRLLGVRPDL